MDGEKAVGIMAMRSPLRAPRGRRGGHPHL